MRYQIVITKRAKKDIDKLDVVANKRLKRFLLKFVLDPLKQSKKLADSKIGQFRYRVGDHRVIFDIEKNKLIILRVGHRGDIYR